MKKPRVPVRVIQANESEQNNEQIIMWNEYFLSAWHSVEVYSS